VHMYLRECPEPKLAEALWLSYKYIRSQEVMKIFRKLMYNVSVQILT